MKYQLKYNGNDYENENIIEYLLQQKGIKNPNEILKVKKDYVEPLENYGKVFKEGWKLLFNTFKNNESIHLVVDSDADGVFSSATLYKGLEFLAHFLQSNSKITYSFQKGKQHGIVLEDLKLKTIDLLIMADSASNDYEQILECKKQNTNVLILDHHKIYLNAEQLKNLPAVLINPQAISTVKNKNIAGTGVVYKFLKYIESQINMDFIDTYLEFFSIGNIADSIDMTELETRYLTLEGLKEIKNEFLIEIIKKKDFSMNSKINFTTIGWYVAPVINATMRIGTQKEKRDMFRALLGEQEVLEYQPKKKDGMAPPLEYHTLQQTMARLCDNIKSKQDNKKKKKMQPLIDKIEENKINIHKVIILDVTNSIDKEYTGLVANILSEKYNRPVILLQKRSVDNQKVIYGGSARGYESVVDNFNSLCLKTKLFEKCAGHDNSFGIEIEEKNVKMLLEKFDELLKDCEVGINKIYSVDLIIPSEHFKEKLITTIGKKDYIWGKGIDEPLIAIENIKINTDKIYYDNSGKNKKVNFKYRGVNFVRNFANEDYYTNLIHRSKIGFDSTRELSITIIGKIVYKEKNGKGYTNIEIIDYESISLGKIDKKAKKEILF